MRLKFDEIKNEIQRVFEKHGMSERKSRIVREFILNQRMTVFIHMEPIVLPDLLTIFKKVG